MLVHMNMFNESYIYLILYVHDMLIVGEDKIAIVELMKKVHGRLNLV